MYFPTWLDMAFMLVAFTWLVVQQMLILRGGIRSTTRMLICAVFIVFMIIVPLKNNGNPPRSTTLFVLSVAALAVSYYMYRRAPSRLPREPRF